MPYSMSKMTLEEWDQYMEDGTLRSLYDDSSKYLEGTGGDTSTYKWHIYEKQTDFGYDYSAEDPDKNGKRQYILQNWRGVVMAENGWMAVIKEDDYIVGIEGGWLGVDMEDNEMKGNLIRCYGLYRRNKANSRSWIYDPNFLLTRRPFVKSLGATQVMWVFQKDSPILDTIPGVNLIGQEYNVGGFIDDSDTQSEDVTKKYEVLEGTPGQTQVTEQYKVLVSKILK
tara:strand:+ start:1544 stop:2221 length:678 start_codon:yes stop_codon:yes gene_type:complete